MILDCLSRRYGRLPHEIMELTPYELTLAWQCYLQANADTARRVKQSDGMVFPVLNLAG